MTGSYWLDVLIGIGAALLVTWLLFIAALAIGRPTGSMLTESFWSGGPFRMNEKAAKFLAKPCGDADYQDQLAQKSRTLFHSDNYLRDDVEASIVQYDLCFDLYVQFQNDPQAQSIEDGTQVWDEVLSPPIEVARVTVPRVDDVSQLDAQQATHRRAARVMGEQAGQHADQQQERERRHCSVRCRRVDVAGRRHQLGARLFAARRDRLSTRRA